jgi:hypothetical protein
MVIPARARSSLSPFPRPPTPQDFPRHTRQQARHVTASHGSCRHSKSINPSSSRWHQDASCQIEDLSTLLCAPQLRISPRSLERIAVNRWRQICSCSGVNRVQSVISSTMRKGALLR